MTQGFFKKDPSFVRINPKHANWIKAEIDFLSAELHSRIEENKSRLGYDEFMKIAAAHNSKFSGTKIAKGDILASGKNAKSAQIIRERSASAIRAMVDKNRDLKDLVKQLVDQYGPHESDSSSDTDLDSDSNMDDETSNDGKHGGDIDHHLEDPSDDEDEGRRPASNPLTREAIAA